MIRLTRHARGLIAALAVLALGAGTALAGPASPSTGSMPDAAAKGLERAAEASGKTVPVAAPAAGADRDEDADEAEDQPADQADQPAADEAEDAQAAEHPDNHGAAVSAAAHADTPAGFANHGQYVRSVATANHGHASDAERGKSGDKGGKPTP